ncbi:MAG: 50S ribosomal protein L11 methyltransferase [Mogibacterium sp.]|nr:50S ribosomal protein L11 methyltransferase [Mogibacterium sp.]
MRYKELKIETGADNLGAVMETLSAAGFVSLAIDDPKDLWDIEAHPEWYRYDYINEELSHEGERNPTVTLYFSDDEEGECEAERAASLLKRLKDSLCKKYKKALKDKAVAATDCGADNKANAEIDFGTDKVAQSEIDLATDKTAKPDKPEQVVIEWTLRDTADDSEWLYKWQEHFRPTRVGERIVVKPSWESYEAEPEDIVIEMDPGMAFGSGLHETTALCIRALEKTPLAAPKVLDVGTGTGILAIAAALLGASECLGIDIDEDVVRIAKENIERNRLSDRIRIESGDLLNGQIAGAETNDDDCASKASGVTVTPNANSDGEPPNSNSDGEAQNADSFTAATQNPNNGTETSNSSVAASRSETFEPDIIVANLMADLIIRLAPAAATRLKSGGIFISSGILDIKEEIVSAAVRAAGFEIQEVLHDGEWRAIVAKRA